MPSRIIKSASSANRYEEALLAVWRKKKLSIKSFEEINFTKEELVKEIKLLQKGYQKNDPVVKNVPDIIYTYRARSELPREILKNGNYAIIGKGKGRYSFIKISQQNRIKIPKKIKETKLTQVIPKWILKYMSDDEQGMLTNLNQNEIIKKYLNLQTAFRLQSHLRMGVPNYGQVEIDELYFCEDTNGKHLICAIEAKDKSDHDLFNISQLFGVSKALISKYPDVCKKILCAKPLKKNKLVICEIAVSDKIKDVRMINEWKAYQIS